MRRMMLNFFRVNHKRDRSLSYNLLSQLSDKDLGFDDLRCWFGSMESSKKEV